MFAVRQPVIKVIGLGGGGSNAIDRMIASGIVGVDFIAANTDEQVLKMSKANTTILLGPNETRGLGAGGKPMVGRAAALESRHELEEALQDADMVFLTAGMGGGTGTGSIAVAAEVAQSLGAVTIAVVTTPFAFEFGNRQHNAQLGLQELRKFTNTLITIPNDRLLEIGPRDLPMEMTFRLADDLLRQAVQGITELITEPGVINVDFAHIRRLMQLGGGSLMCIGYGEGKNKALNAVEQALSHPLLGDDVSIENASGIIANFTGGADLSLFEVGAALGHLQEKAGNHAEIVMGIINNESMSNRTEVILIVTGLGGATLEDAMRQANQQRQNNIPNSAYESPTSPGRSILQPVTERSKRTEAANAQPVDANTEEPVEVGVSANAAPYVSSRQRANTNIDLPAFMRKNRRYDQ
jgi:cell division protein FtsZ